MLFSLSLIPHSKGQRYRDTEELAACVEEFLPAMHAYRDEKSLLEAMTANFILSMKGFESLRRDREATKGKHFLSLMMSQVSSTTVPA